MNIYLAGGLDTHWRFTFKSEAPGHNYLDPTDHYHIEAEDAYTLLDLEMVRMADLVVAYLAPDNPSLYGSSLEMGYAHGLGIPVIVIDALGDDWRKPYFGMARSIAVATVPDISTAIEVLNAMPR